MVNILLTSEAAAAGQTFGGISIIIVYAIIILAMWFFMFRPQKNEQKRVAAMLAELAVGDCVLTTSGFYGIVISMEDDNDTIIVEFGNNKNCRIPMTKTAISKVEKPESNK